jgi:hypothetical protein
MVFISFHAGVLLKWVNKFTDPSVNNPEPLRFATMALSDPLTTRLDLIHDTTDSIFDLHNYFFVLKVWWHAATLFIYFDIYRAYIQYFLYIILVECHSWSPHCFRSVEGLLVWGAEPRFELGPAIQQADALLSEPRRTHTTILIRYPQGDKR